MAGKWRTYFELLRLPAVFTAMADVMMGYLVTHGGLRPILISGLLVASSAMMYLAGMVLNDYFDAEVDAIERPNRPIPSGRIERAAARRLGLTLLIGGFCVAVTASFVARDCGPISAGGFLAILVWEYNAAVKSRIGKPIVMGFCRLLNVALGMSIVGAGEGAPIASLWTRADAAIMFGMWAYIAGVTVFAQGEAGKSSRGQLTIGIGLMTVGIGFFGYGACHFANPSQFRWIVWLVVGAYVAMRHGLALIDANSRAVQRSVRHALRMIIFLDWLVAFEAAPHSSGSMLILLLYVPMLALEYWFSTT